jgi:hypothetical protein
MQLPPLQLPAGVRVASEQEALAPQAVDAEG